MCLLAVIYRSLLIYADRLHKLGIKSLEYRRLEFHVILMFKIYYRPNLSDLQFDD